MLRQLISGLVREKAAQMGRRLAGLFVILFAVLLLFLGFLVSLFALYLWLSEQMPVWYAALCVAAILLVLAGTAFVIGRRSMRGRPRREIPADAELRTLLSDVAKAPGKQSSLTLVAAAAVLGLLVGRNVSK